MLVCFICSQALSLSLWLCLSEVSVCLQIKTLTPDRMTIDAYEGSYLNIYPGTFIFSSSQGGPSANFENKHYNNSLKSIILTDIRQCCHGIFYPKGVSMEEEKTRAGWFREIETTVFDPASVFLSTH